MQELLAEYSTLASGAFVIILVAHLSLLIFWPLFLLLEKTSPAGAPPPRSNYWLNWKITAGNVALAPGFSALIVLLTVSFTGWLGLPSLELSTVELSVGYPLAIGLKSKDLMDKLNHCVVDHSNYTAQLKAFSEFSAASRVSFPTMDAQAPESTIAEGKYPGGVALWKLG